MSRERGSSIIPIIVFLAVLTIVLPVGAYNVAIYGTDAGFNPDLHPGEVTVVRSIPGATGADLDANIDQFVQPSVDVIILGGDASFSPATAAKIEAAVAGGKILVVTYPCNHLFGPSLPASNGGTTVGGLYLEVSDPTSVLSRTVFAQLPTMFNLQGAAPDKEQVIANAGTITVLNYDTGMPALLYGKYGKGHVIEWTTVPSPSYMNEAQADLILHRMILELLPDTLVTQTTVTATQTTTIIPRTTTIVPPTTLTPVTSPVQVTEPVGMTGDIMIYSSPAGASILIDDVYYGTTPGKVIGVPVGSHILLLTLSGYQDNTQTVIVGPGATNRAYGTLQPLTQYTPFPTTVPTPVPTMIVPIIIATPTPVPTQDSGLLGNSSVLVALIGVITALIAAGASVFTHIKPPKKE